MSDGLIAIETRPVRNRFPPGWAKSRHLPRQRIALRQRQNDSSILQSDAWLALANARMHRVHDGIVWSRRGLWAPCRLKGLIWVCWPPSISSWATISRLGLAYNFSRISGDLTALTALTALTDDSQGAFINLIASF